jgi:mitochondrial fission protein ELM1
MDGYTPTGESWCNSSDPLRLVGEEKTLMNIGLGMQHLRRVPDWIIHSSLYECNRYEYTEVLQRQRHVAPDLYIAGGGLQLVPLSANDQMA